MDFFIDEAALKHTYEGIDAVSETSELEVVAYTSGALAMLEAIHELVQESREKNSTTPQRDAFYEYYNRTVRHKQREDQQVLVGNRRYSATWVEDPYGEQCTLGCFWSGCSASRKDERWDNYASGPLEGNPQTEREAQLQLLAMASW